MLISGVIVSTLLIGAMSIILFVGVILIPIERMRQGRRNYN
jgi:hypothetical protein